MVCRRAKKRIMRRDDNTKRAPSQEITPQEPLQQPQPAAPAALEQPQRAADVVDLAAAPSVRPDTRLALVFLNMLDPDGRHDLTALNPDLPPNAPGHIETATFLPGERAAIRRCWRHYAPGVPVRRKRPRRDVSSTVGTPPPRRLKPAPLKPARRTAVVMKPAQPERATSAPEEDDLQAIIETYRFALNMMDD